MAARKVAYSRDNRNPQISTLPTDSRWTVLGAAGRNAHGHALWCVRCECGTEATRAAPMLKRGDSRSCGCLARQLSAARMTKHGKSQTREYKHYVGLISRCTNPRNKRWPNYGGRGIKVCDMWLYGDGEKSGFECFDEYVIRTLGPCPSGHTIDRINNDGHYEPGNVRWASDIVQGNNKRCNRRVIWRGEAMTVAQIIRLSGTKIKYGTICQRIKTGWNLQRAIDTPLSRKFKYHGHKVTLVEAIALAGNRVSYKAAYQRIQRRGWSVERAVET